MRSDKKISAIYAAVDSGNYSEAARLCQKPDVSSIPLVRSLLSYVYAVTGRRDDAVTLAQEIIATPHAILDESVVNALASALKIARADDVAIRMFEQIFALDASPLPPSEQIYHDFFGALIRVGDFKRMQIQAQKMTKSLDNQVRTMKDCPYRSPFPLPPTVYSYQGRDNHFLNLRQCSG